MLCHGYTGTHVFNTVHKWKQLVSCVVKKRKVFTQLRPSDLKTHWIPFLPCVKACCDFSYCKYITSYLNGFKIYFVSIPKQLAMVHFLCPALSPNSPSPPLETEHYTFGLTFILKSEKALAMGEKVIISKGKAEFIHRNCRITLAFY